MDFSEYQESGRFYAGSERKLGIKAGNESCYMLKFQKITPFGKAYNHISEYLGSHIFTLAGMESQDTVLGIYQDEPVVACRDFTSSSKQFVPFNDVGESTLEDDRESYQYDYADIMRMLKENSKLTNVEETIQAFWRMYVIDALTGNFDRHGANWGFVKESNRYRLAPIFDNGSCLFPRLVDDEALAEVMGSENEMLKRVFGFPTSQIRMGGKKSSYYDVISEARFPECDAAVAFVREHLSMEVVHALVEELDCITPLRREFYHSMLDLRWEHLVWKPLEKLVGGVL